MAELEVDPARRVDLEAAWRLAFVVTGDGVSATSASTEAFAESPGGELLAATLRRSLEQADESRPVGPVVAPGSAVLSALWELPADQRAALWLTEVLDLNDRDLAKVLGLPDDDVGRVATRAARWLDVALDHKSGPLCQHEPKLADYLKGNLPAVEAAEIDDHLPGCPTCTSKAQAYEELDDLAAVLRRAVPNPPTDLATQAADRNDGTRTSPAHAFERTGSTAALPPAVRPLAACCAGLLVIGLVGVGVVRSPKSTGPAAGTAKVSSTVQTVLPAASSDVAGVPSVPATTSGPATTSTTALTVTFPTLPPGGTRTTKR